MPTAPGTDLVPVEVNLVAEETGWRCELLIFVLSGGFVKDTRIRGPRRQSQREAIKDASELKKTAQSHPNDPTLVAVRLRRKKLEAKLWLNAELGGKDVADLTAQLTSGSSADQGVASQVQEVFAIEKQAATQARSQVAQEEWCRQIAERRGDVRLEFYKPVGSNWKVPGPGCILPAEKQQPQGSWMIYERQDAAGKYRPWLFFNTATGKYFQERSQLGGYLQIGVPHNPTSHAVRIAASSAALPSTAGKKLAVSVILAELHKTAFMLKLPLGFLDKPAALLLLCDGLRGSSAAAELCAKRFHSLILPRLSDRTASWEDFELADVVTEVCEALDSQVLDSAHRFGGCALAVALLVGERVVLGSLGSMRCIVCPLAAVSDLDGGSARHMPKARQASTHESGGSATVLCGESLHTLANPEERLRVESAAGRLLGDGLELNGLSPTSEAGLADSTEIVTEIQRIAMSSTPFAVLGVQEQDLREGAEAIRRRFRSLSRLVHPDKVEASLQEVAQASFAKLENASSAVEAMLLHDMEGTVLLEEVLRASVQSCLSKDAAAAAKLLRVDVGCSPEVAQRASQHRFHMALNRLQDVCRKEVARALDALRMAEEAVSRPSPPWLPEQDAEAVTVTRAIGCADLKCPDRMMTAVPATEVVALPQSSSHGIALLTAGVCLCDEDVVGVLQRHPGRPRAAALQLTRLAESGTQGVSGVSSGMGAVCAFTLPEQSVQSRSEQRHAAAAPPSKRNKVGASTERARVSHILLRWANMKGTDPHVRSKAPSSRARSSQLEAEIELLEILEDLLSSGKGSGAAAAGVPLAKGFHAAVVAKSECVSALNAPYADLGWIERTGKDPELEAAAFATAIGGLSDIFISSRGAHLLYRMG